MSNEVFFLPHATHCPDHWWSSGFEWVRVGSRGCEWVPVGSSGLCFTVITSHASKPMEHGLSGDLIRGSSSGVRPKSQRDAIRSSYLRGGGYPSMIPLNYGTLFLTHYVYVDYF